MHLLCSLLSNGCSVSLLQEATRPVCTVCCSTVQGACGDACTVQQIALVIPQQLQQAACLLCGTEVHYSDLSAQDSERQGGWQGVCVADSVRSRYEPHLLRWCTVLCTFGYRPFLQHQTQKLKGVQPDRDCWAG